MEINDLSMIAPPNEKAASTFINESITSMNNSFFLPRITQNDESFLSPAVHSSAPVDIAELGITAKALDAIRSHVQQDMETTFNNKAIEFFHQFESRVESAVDMKMDSTSYKESLLQHIERRDSTQVDNQLERTLKKFDERYEDFIDKYDKFNLVNDKHQTSQETLTDQIQSVRADITVLDEALKNLQINAEEELAKKIQSLTSKSNSDALDL